ncbi:MAG TPA: hypothetical protein VFR97_10785 [Capillimicrobium sp.]|nr:hypothetical protein [Capillimicrobium sp.]
MDLLSDAAAFLQTHARLLERRRFELLFAGGGPEGALAALAAYGNADGGFGWGLEPDLRAPGSQPAGALHAFEVLEEVGPAGSATALALCDWLDGVTLPDGGLPFALAGAAGPGTAPWWAGADPASSSLHITAAICEAAQRVAAHDPAVAAHPWLARATAFCLGAIAELDEPSGAYELRYVLWLLDALHDTHADAREHLDRLADLVPASATLPVAGGVEGEALRPLDVSPRPAGPLRARIAADAIAADLDRLVAERRADGGWDVDFATQSPASALEWRGYATVRALKLLRAHGAAPA